MSIRYILWSYGIFLRFWYVVARKIWQPGRHLMTLLVRALFRARIVFFYLGYDMI
jgi:hypothetical protein